MKVKSSSVFLILNLLVLFLSCNGQNALNNSGNKNGRDSLVSRGEIVRELEGSLLVVFQDQKNNYWFGTKDKGVYKYDGKNLVLFTSRDGLYSNSIIGIQEDKLGNLYLDTQGGVSKFDGQKFTTLEILTNNPSKNEWRLDPDDLWFRLGWNKNGPYRYDGEKLYHLEFPKTNQEEQFYLEYPNSSFSPYAIYSMYKDRKGTLWLGTASLGVCRYDGVSISWLYERHLTKTPNGGDFGIRSIIEDKEGYFWFCNTRYRYEILPNTSARNGTNQINYRTKNGIAHSTDNQEKDFPYFMSIAEDDAGDLWMLTYDDGVWRNDGEKLFHYPIQADGSNVLLFSIYKDRQGGLWLGTHNAGVYKFNGQEFERFKIK